MNGVFKFKEHMAFKYKKRIGLAAGVAIILATVVRFTPSNEPKVEGNAIEPLAVVEEQVAVSGYDVFLKDICLGTIRNKKEGQVAVEHALELAIETLGYDPEVEQLPTYKERYTLENTYITADALAKKLEKTLIENLEEIKVKACVMKIGDDFTIAVKDQEAIKEVLRRAQSIYVTSKNIKININLAKDVHNGLVIRPSVIMQKAPLEDRTFKTAINEVIPTEETGGAEEIISEKAEEVIEKDVRSDGETIDIEFAEEVLIVEGYVSKSEIKDIDEATELITKENEEAKVYEIVSGDIPSKVAKKNDMELATLFELNPDLETHQRTMQIGDELIVLVPEPELSVITKEEVIYTEPIARETTYKENPDKYVGSNQTIDAGEDGVLEVTAIVAKLNGDETGREIMSTKVIKAPQNKIISKGSKPLPVKGATGNFISPLVSYRISSRYGKRGRGFHSGIDLAVATGTSVRASDGGVVTIAGWKSSYGYLVEIDHGNGVKTRYGHNSQLNVKVGQTVSQYEEIAKSGNTGRSTGPHVHFEIRFDNVTANPEKYVNF